MQIAMDRGYFFDVTLPYSLQIPIGKSVEFLYAGLSGVFVHIEKIKATSMHNIEFSPHLYIPGDKYGAYFSSRVRIIYDEESVSKIHLQESQKTRNIYEKTNEYVSLCFGLPGTKLKAHVVGAINKILNIYRVISQEWHATPVTSKDLVNFVLFRFALGEITQLSIIPDSHRIMSGKNELFGHDQMELLKKGASFEGVMSPLLILEADIHDKATQGEFVTACVLIGLISEEAIKAHIVQYFVISERIHLNKAKQKLVKPDGHHLGISQLVDKPKKQEICFIDSIIGWKPFMENEYLSWDTNVRKVRNNIIHASLKEISHQQVVETWKACVEFVGLSRKKFVEKLLLDGKEVSDGDIMKFFAPISANVFTQGLIGEFSNVSA